MDSRGLRLLSVGFDVVARGLFGVLGAVRLVSVGEVSVMCGGMMVAGIMVLRGFRVMVGGHSVVMGGLAMMMRCLF